LQHEGEAMTEKPLDWHNMKLAEGSLYKTDKFIRLLVNDMGREIQDIENLLAFVLNDAEAASLDLKHLPRNMTVLDICELILQRTHKMQAILNMACQYANRDAQ